MSRYEFKQREELQRLAAALCDGSATEADRERLQKLLDLNEEAVRDYVRYLDLHAQLQWQHRGAQAAPAELAEVHGVGTIKRWATYFARPTPFSMSTAALVVVLIIVGMGLVAPPVYRHFAQRGQNKKENVPRNVVGRITAAQQAKWGPAQFGGHVGTYLAADHAVDLLEGFAEVTLKSGAKMVIEGPTSLRVVSINSGYLAHGRVVCHVPEAARGFVLETSQSTITDLGTEFGVEATTDGTVDVAVFVGEIEVAQATTGPDVSTRKLVAGESIHINSAGVVSSAKGSGTGLVRLLPAQLEKSNVLSIDFNARSHVGISCTEEGFEEFVLASQTEPTTRAFGDLQVTVTAAGGSGLDDRYRSSFGGGPKFGSHALYRDFIFGPNAAGETLETRIQGLKPGQLYEVMVWSFNNVGGSSVASWYLNDKRIVEKYEINPRVRPESILSNRIVAYERADAQGELHLSGRHFGPPSYSVIFNGFRISEVTGDSTKLDR